MFAHLHSEIEGRVSWCEETLESRKRIESQRTQKLKELEERKMNLESQIAEMSQKIQTSEDALKKIMEEKHVALEAKV